MTITTIMSILSAPGTGVVSANGAGAALGTGASGFGSLVQMLLADQGTGGGTHGAGAQVPDQGKAQGQTQPDAEDASQPGVPNAQVALGSALTGSVVSALTAATVGRADVTSPGATTTPRTEADKAQDDRPAPDASAVAPTAPAPTAPAPTAPAATALAGAVGGQPVASTAAPLTVAAQVATAGTHGVRATGTPSAAAVPGAAAPGAAGTGDTSARPASGADAGQVAAPVDAPVETSTVETGAGAPGPRAAEGRSATWVAEQVHALGTPDGGTPAAPERRHAGAAAPVGTGSSVGPLAGTAATSAVFGTAGTAQTMPTSRTETSGHVAGQVIPEVARMVTRGDGTQRLTLRLSPEALGDVRIVVTVRDGAVDVSLAAGADAQEALRTGSPELLRLLESLGVASTQISVRDLPSAGQSAGQSTGQSTGHSAAQQYGGGTADAGGTGANARDAHGNGSHGQHTTAGGDRAATAQSPGPLRSGPHDPTTPGTLAGLDLRL